MTIRDGQYFKYMYLKYKYVVTFFGGFFFVILLSYKKNKQNT